LLSIKCFAAIIALLDFSIACATILLSNINIVVTTSINLLLANTSITLTATQRQRTSTIWVTKNVISWFRQFRHTVSIATRSIYWCTTRAIYPRVAAGEVDVEHLVIVYTKNAVAVVHVAAASCGQAAGGSANARAAGSYSVKHVAI
jgi:hypothetical protein